MNVYQILTITLLMISSVIVGGMIGWAVGYPKGRARGESVPDKVYDFVKFQADAIRDQRRIIHNLRVSLSRFEVGTRVSTPSLANDTRVSIPPLESGACLESIPPLEPDSNE